MGKKGLISFSSFTRGVVGTDEAPLPGDRMWTAKNVLLDTEGFVCKREGLTELGATPFAGSAITSVHGILHGGGVNLLVQSGTSLKTFDSGGNWVTPSGAAPTVALELKSAQYHETLYLFNGTDFLAFKGGTITNLGHTTIGKSRRCIAWSNRLWAFDDPDNDDRLYYSALDEPELFTGDFYRVDPRVGGRMVAAVPTMQMLLLVKNNAVYAAVGSPSVDADMSAFEIHKMFDNKGCVAADTVAATGTGFMCLWNDGIYLFQIGAEPINLTKEAFNNFFSDIDINGDYLNKCSAVIYDQKYVLMYPSGSSTYANKGLVLDLRFPGAPCTFIEGVNLVDMTQVSFTFNASEAAVLASDSFGDSSLNTGLWTAENNATESNYGEDMQNCARLRRRVIVEGDEIDTKTDDPDEITVGTGTISDPFIVRTAADLDAVRDDLTAYYKQIRNIDASALTWVPIGTGSSFTGGYDGNEYKITGLILPAQTFSGMFSTVDSAGSLYDIYLIGVDGSGLGSSSYCGALCGQNNGLIHGCASTGVITTTGDYIGGLIGRNQGIVEAESWSSCAVDAGAQVGGLIGVCQDSSFSVKNCFAGGDVSGSGNAVGGLIGYISYPQGAVFLESCYATGNVQGVNSCGGLVGTVYRASNNSTVQKCCATGKVESSGNHCGGFIGSWLDYASRNSYIKSSYATGGVIKLGGAASIFGGFIGYCGFRIKCSDCYATGEVDAASNGAAFMGASVSTAVHSNCYATGKVTVAAASAGGFSYGGGSDGTTACYWDTETTEQATSTTGVGKTTAEMKQEASFSGWDFTDIWQITEDESYPSHTAAASPPEPVPASEPGWFNAGLTCSGSYALTVKPVFNLGVYYEGADKDTDGFFVGLSSDTTAPTDWDSDSVLTNPIGFKILNDRIYILFSSSITDTGVDIALNSWVRFKITMSSGAGAKFEYHNGSSWSTIAEPAGGPAAMSLKPFMYNFEPEVGASSEVSLYVRGFSIDQGTESFTAVEKPMRLYAGSSDTEGKIFRMFTPDTFSDDGASITIEIGGGWNHDPNPGQRKKLLQGVVDFEAAPGDLGLSFYADTYSEPSPDFSMDLNKAVAWSGVKRQLLRFRHHLNYRRLRWRLTSSSKTDVKLYYIQLYNVAKKAIFSTGTEV